MKVCLLNVEFEINAGTERIVAFHAEKLKKAGHEVDIACAYYKPSVFPEKFKNFNIIEYAKELEDLSFMRRTRVSLSLLRRSIKFLKDYDVIIAYRPFTNIMAMRAKKKYGTKILWYCNHPEKHLYPKYFKTLNKKNFIFRTALLPGLGMDKESVKHFDRIYVNSHHMWTKFNLIYDYNNHIVLYLSCDSFKKAKKGDCLISISRVEPEKNQLVLLKALTRVKNKFKTVFIGQITNQGYYEELKRFIKEHELDVEFTGRQDDKGMQSWYDKSFLSIFTPYDEDFGMVPVESLSAAKPVLTHVSNGVSEVLPDRFVYSTVDELAVKIDSFINHDIKGLTRGELRIPSRIREHHVKQLLLDVES